MPASGDGDIEEDQTFLVAANLPSTPASIAANAYCAVDVLAPDLPGKLLSAMSYFLTGLNAATAYSLKYFEAARPGNDIADYTATLNS